MEAVTLDQFKEWLEKNKNLTWYLDEGGGFKSPNFTAYIKYFYLGFDTRDMKIFSIRVRGWVEFEVYTSNEYRDESGNLLDLLDRKLKEAIQNITSKGDEEMADKGSKNKDKEKNKTKKKLTIQEVKERKKLKKEKNATK